MANIKVTEENIKLLELKVDLAYETLKRAVETQEPLLIPSSECLYQHDIGDYLSELTGKATHSFRRLNKGGKRASKIEKYILQYVLMHCPFSEGDTYKMKIAGNPSDGMGGLKAFLDAKDDLSSENGEVFRLIQHKAEELRKAGKYNSILKALDYIRRQ